MNLWWNYGAMVVLQVTVIASLAILMMARFRRSASMRHAIGLIALIAVGISPWTSLWLPQPRWITTAFGPSVNQLTVSDLKPVPSSTGNLSGGIDSAILSETQSEFSESTFDKMSDSRESLGLEVSRQSSLGDVGASSLGESSRASGVRTKVSWNRVLQAVLGCLYGLGVLYLACRYFLGLSSVRRIQRSAKPVAWGRDQVERMRAVFGSRPTAWNRIGGTRQNRASWIESIPMMESKLAPMPMVYGTFRQSIILPEGFSTSDSESQTVQVLIHELAHIYRKDSIVCGLQRFLAILWWPNPLIHWLNREVSEAREEICDNFVLQHSHPIAYAETLLAYAQRFTQIGQGRISLGLYARPRTLEQRIEGLLSDHRVPATGLELSRWIVLVALFSTTIVLAGGSNNHDYSTLLGWIPSAPQDDAKREVISIPSKTVKQRLSIQGECIDQVGNPLENVRVRLVRVPESQSEPLQYLQEVQTSSDGRFRFEDAESFIEKGTADELLDLVVVSDLDEFTSNIRRLVVGEDLESLELKMTSNIGTLTGKVVDGQGKPVAGAKVYLPSGLSRGIEGVFLDMTDEEGKFEIDDLMAFQGNGNTSMAFYVDHPDFATSRGGYQSIPQEVQVTLQPATYIEGRVIDRVSNSYVAGATVNFQGIGGSDWISTKTDVNGKYRVKTGSDYYNAWSEMEGRIAIAAKNIEVTVGKTSNADIELVRGSWVEGKIIDSSTGKPVSGFGAGTLRVAHHGPARPLSGAAVASTAVNEDASFRLQLAPGRNYVYLMTGGASFWIDVEDGQIKKQNLETGKVIAENELQEHPDRIFRSQVARAFFSPAGLSKFKKKVKERAPDTKVGKLIERLEVELSQFADPSDKWLRPMHELVQLGEAAVPELIEELDATEDDKMLRALAFTLRAIGDRRAIPALIRSIPRTLIPPGSDYGLLARDPTLLKFAQKHDLASKNENKYFDFGRPVREVFGALQALSSQKFDEEQLYSIFLDGTEQQQDLKRKAYQKSAVQWSNWWESNAPKLVSDPAYHQVRLKEIAVAEPSTKLTAETRLKTGSGGSNWVLESAHEEDSKNVFVDLDTGKTSPLPKQWRADEVDQKLDEILKWATSEGYDLMGSDHLTQNGAGSCYCLVPIGLQLWELPEKRWKMTSEDISLAELQEEGRPTDELFHYDESSAEYVPTAVGSFLYITKDGAPGLLFLGIEVTNDSQQNGGAISGDNELNPVAFDRGRRFGFTYFEVK